MKYSALLILLLFSASFSVAQRRSGCTRLNMQTQQQQETQDNTKFDRMKAQTERHPSAKQVQAADAMRLKLDADELALLAQSVPPDVEQTTKGILSKDLDQRLKRIEKLAKQLRSRISH